MHPSSHRVEDAAHLQGKGNHPKDNLKEGIPDRNIGGTCKDLLPGGIQGMNTGVIPEGRHQGTIPIKDHHLKIIVNVHHRGTTTDTIKDLLKIEGTMNIPETEDIKVVHPKGDHSSDPIIRMIGAGITERGLLRDMLNHLPDVQNPREPLEETTAPTAEGRYMEIPQAVYYAAGARRLRTAGW
jgi:hypothetical protein